MTISRLTDFIYAFRLLNLIQTPWEDQEAFKLGIVDANGKPLKKWTDLRTSEEKDNYTMFHRLAFNMKRALQKVPGFNSKILQVATALRLLKESDADLERVFTDEEIQYIGQKLLEDVPTNVTGAAIGAPVDKPLKKKQVARRATPVEVKKDVL